jgi:murein DD-endopeptidase MepM/ murein hydrolase activator NlpD
VEAIAIDKPKRSALRRTAAVLSCAIAGSALFAAGASAQVTAPPETTTTTPTAPAAPAGFAQVFPIPAAYTHTFNQGFGVSRGRRGHMGVDVFSPCNTPLVAVSNARVVFRGFHAAAGNYVVIRYKKLKQDYMYAHLAVPPLVRKGQRVVVGQQLGIVGDTGNAAGCHLHFELWIGKWYRGGRAVDPLPSLTYWDTYS